VDDDVSCQRLVIDGTPCYIFLLLLFPSESLDTDDYSVDITSTREVSFLKLRITVAAKDCGLDLEGGSHGSMQ